MVKRIKKEYKMVQKMKEFEEERQFKIS